MFRVNVKEFYRDFGSIFFSFAFPLMFVVMLVVNSGTSEQYRFRLGIVDEHGSANVIQVMEALARYQFVQAEAVEQESIQGRLADGTLHAYLILPKDGINQGAGQVELVVDPQYEEFSDVLLEAIYSRVLTGGLTKDVIFTQPDTQSKSDFSFIFPGMLALALLQLGLFATATPVLRARERGTMLYLLLTPLTSFELIASQISLRMIIAITQITLLLFVGSFATDLSWSSWISVMGVSILGAMMLVSFGYAIAGFSPNQEFGLTLIMVLNFGMIFGGNIFWDTNSSSAVSFVAHLIPLSYLADMNRQLISGIDGVWPFWVDLLVVTGFTIGSIVVAVRTFKFDMKSRK